VGKPLLRRLPKRSLAPTNGGLWPQHISFKLPSYDIQRQWSKSQEDEDQSSSVASRFFCMQHLTRRTSPMLCEAHTSQPSTSTCSISRATLSTLTMYGVLDHDVQFTSSCIASVGIRPYKSRGQRSRCPNVGSTLREHAHAQRLMAHGWEHVREPIDQTNASSGLVCSRCTMPPFKNHCHRPFSPSCHTGICIGSFKPLIIWVL
jgi:hypothetical protein